MRSWPRPRWPWTGCRRGGSYSRRDSRCRWNRSRWRRARTWRYGRGRASCRCRSRRRQTAHRGKNIHAAPAINVVGWPRIAALSGSDMHSRVVQRIAAVCKLVAQTRNCIPQQGHSSCNMRSSHGCAAEKGVRAIRGIGARASGVTWSSNVGLYPPASVSCNRTTATEGSNVIGTGIQSSDRVGRLVNSRRIFDGGTIWPGVLRG